MGVKIFITVWLVIAIVQFSKGLDLRITNGVLAKPGEFPFIVSVRYYGKHNCGGMILDERNILTAAHCVHRKQYTEMEIQTGDIKIDINHNSNNTIKAQYWIIHDFFKNYGSYENDIAIIKLLDNITFRENVQPVKLPSKDWVTVPDSNVIVAGWGRNDTDGVLQPDLQKVHLKAMTQQECANEFGEWVKEEYHQCAGKNTGHAFCYGDSGGPLVDEKTKTLIGIVSWTRDPCSKYSGVYTKVANYLDWIETNRQV